MLRTIGITLWCLILTLTVCGSASAARVALPKTGQTTSYAPGDDGALQKGVAWPIPRFTNNGDGTVKDNLTGLIWLKNANCTDTVGGIVKSGGKLTWANALTWSNNLASGACGLADGSTAGQWRLPNVNELASLIDLSSYGPALPAGHPFTSVKPDVYWSGSYSWGVGLYDGFVGTFGANSYVWPVRAGQ